MKNEHAVALGKLAGKKSWASQSKGKTKKQISEMMRERANKRYQKLSTISLA